MNHLISDRITSFLPCIETTVKYGNLAMTVHLQCPPCFGWPHHAGKRASTINNNMVIIVHTKQAHVPFKYFGWIEIEANVFRRIESSINVE
ncbi:unnamed protein product [Haemonchus placei]|uniref:Uncharacterized protein n=1 Tax=Haemonchus placei TaxID=6290 RepID=A0A3P7Z2D4_HAEPC|nr:unnamed protein product [Haemonchus placei]